MANGRRHIYSGRVISLDLEDVRLPNGHVATLELVTHPGGAAVVALNEHGEVCLLHQYRHIAGGFLTELPAGKLDGRPAADVAIAELAEEAGLRARRWDPLGRYFSSPGVFSEIVHLYLARELEPCATAREPEEVIEVRWQPLAEAVRRALAGEIVDGKTIVGLLRAQAVLAGRVNVSDMLMPSAV
jgi:8-oxo-dGTP pyrophosphatase MutT (NUDIX family)